MKVKRILVANRGEIARRVFRTARKMGLGCVAVYAPNDSQSPHIADADEAVEIPSYLDADAIIASAKATEANAIHPGYGFLSERAAFSEKCADAGVTFIGPSPEAMRALGDKVRSREIASKLGIPIADGFGPATDLAEIAGMARRLGPPLLIKAAAGGGGKGMKRLLTLDLLDEEVAASQRETKAAFGDDRLIVERYIRPARHIEVQIVADGKRAIAFGERECSLQRRHQKIIEESPSAFVDEPLRQRLFDAAVAIAQEAGYKSAGTIEFLVGPNKEFYFLEVNARLQVEHPVTEMRTGVDLVQLQIEVANGGELPSQEHLTFHGHAIEARLNAEDPYNGFLPSAGRILYHRFADSVRVDECVGETVSTNYDSMLAKIIAHGKTREEARLRLITGLQETALLGVATNQSFLVELLESKAFHCGETYTHTVDELEIGPRPVSQEAAIAAAIYLSGKCDDSEGTSIWHKYGAWRLK